MFVMRMASVPCGIIRGGHFDSHRVALALDILEISSFGGLKWKSAKNLYGNFVALRLIMLNKAWAGVVTGG